MKYLDVKSSLFAAYEERMKNEQDKVSACHKFLHRKGVPPAEGISDMTGWVRFFTADQEIYITAIEAYAEKIKKESNALVLIGIGGSFLGARAGIKFLRNATAGKGVDVYYAGWNLSGSYHARLLKELADKEVSVCVVSKSGKTTETTFAFELLKAFMAKKYKGDYRDRIYAVTDANVGLLAKEAKQEGYHTLTIEEDIGGRYSVLTAVGLLPMAAAGIDIRSVVRGAQAAYDDLLLDQVMENPAYAYAMLRNFLYEEGKASEFFSIMEPHMQSFSAWLRQLFGESEGKNGRGILPVCVEYSTDLHSIGQFIQEGTPMFFESLISVKESDAALPFRFDGKTYEEMNRLVCNAVETVREESSTPLLQFILKDFSEETLGYTLYFFEKACAMSCLLQGLDPFNQPGVEIYKSEVLHLLKKGK